MYIPLGIYIFIIFALLFITKMDSIKFLVNEPNKKDEAYRALTLLYKHCNSDERREEFYNHFRAFNAESSSAAGLSSALCNPQYRRATWINIGYIIFHELTGINVIILYSTTMFKEMHKGGGGISPKTGTYIVGFTNAFTSFIAVFFIKYFGRRTLIIWGHILIGIVHCLVGVFNILEYNNGVIAMIVLFLVFYENSSGPIAWLYAVETCIDSAMGICLLTLWFTVCVLS